jgi:hypothetical protein
MSVGVAAAQSGFVSNRRDWWEIEVKYPVFRSKGAVARTANSLAKARAKSSFDRFLATAKKELPPMKAERSFAQYGLVMEPKVALDTPEVASAYWETYTFTGGAHGVTNYEPLNLASFGGHIRGVQLKDLFVKGVDPVAESSKALLQILLKKNTPSWVEEGSWNGLSPEQAQRFAITKKGIVFLFDSYDLGSYAEGTWEILVPYSQLFGLNRDGILKSVLRG